jgi:hypothetical protein
MKRLLVATPLVMLYGLVGLGTQPAAPSAPQPPTPAVAPRVKWEYNVITNLDLRADETPEKALNKLGDEGWELVSVVPAAGGPAGGPGGPRGNPSSWLSIGPASFVFKRPKS